MDETNSPLLDLLDQLDLAGNTIVLFTSDHGEAFLEHGHFLHQDLYRETLHAPLIVRFPDEYLPDCVSTPRSLLDVMPTILELACSLLSLPKHKAGAWFPCGAGNPRPAPHHQRVEWPGQRRTLLIRPGRRFFLYLRGR